MSDAARPPELPPAREPPVPRGWRDRLRAALPSSPLGWTWLATGALGVLSVAYQLLSSLAPMLASHGRIGRRGWDAAAALRYLPVKSILRFHAMPWWNPYACGGSPAWAAPEGDPNVVSPLLPVYLAMPLGRAMDVEVLVFSIAGAAGTWLLASRFTRSRALRALAVVVFALDGRWTMQIAAGHFWHLGYALVPWALFFLDRAIGGAPELGLWAGDGPPRPRRRDVAWAGACLALLVYGGDAYLLPQVSLLLLAYVTWIAVASRSARPLGVLAQSVAIAAGLAAPKLVPALDVASRYHRVVTEAVRLSPQALSIALFDPAQSFRANVPGVDMNAWCEVGLYIGAAGGVWLALGALLASGPREQALRAMAAVFLALGLGPFHENSPWSFARALPLLSSQAMPSRWLYLAVLAMACVAAGVCERLLSRSGRARAWLEGALAIAVAWAAYDVAAVARRPLDEEMKQGAVAVEATPEQTTPFVTEARLPASLQAAAGDAPAASLPAERANLGTIECDTFAGLANAAALASRYPAYDGRPAGLGARGRGDPDYHGEAFVDERRGTATITAWSPDAVDVTVDGAQPGDHVVLDQNDDPGWRVSGADRASVDQTVAGVLRSGRATVRFRYAPRGLWLGIVLFAATVGVLLRARRRRPGMLST